MPQLQRVEIPPICVKVRRLMTWVKAGQEEGTLQNVRGGCAVDNSVE